MIIEFAGLPGAGKTSVSRQLATALSSRLGTSRWVEEAAQRTSEISMPRFKDDWRFSVWTLSDTLARLIDGILADEDEVIVLDRGLTDVACWLRWFARERGEITDSDLDRLEGVIRISEWHARLAAVIYLDVSLDEALNRGKTPGRINSPDVFPSLRATYADSLLHGSLLPGNALLCSLDTTQIGEASVLMIAEAVAVLAAEVGATRTHERLEAAGRLATSEVAFHKPNANDAKPPRDVLGSIASVDALGSPSLLAEIVRDD